MFPQIEPGHSRHAGYHCDLKRRGRYEFGPWKASTRFPLGLVEAMVSSELTETLLVGPRIGELTPSWRRLMDDDRQGSHRTHNRQGAAEGEFYGLREWRRGDSRRWIHWRTSARTNELTVRQFEQQRNLDLALVIDLALPNEPSKARVASFERMLSFAATVIADRCRQGGGQVTVTLAGTETKEYASNASPIFLQDMMDALALIEGDHEVALVPALDRAYEIAPRGARVVVFSSRQLEPETMSPELFWNHDPRKLHAFRNTLWIDIHSEEAKQWFQLERLEK